MPKKSPTQDGRTVVSDDKIPEKVRGVIGIFFAWTSPATGYTILFVYIYSLASEGNVA